ncbi:uncharacterized protein LAJ45_08129 [Morchella importuna]|uniref:uncharacterized protein n=1 Tax=Morchella importuna TaxID=1174673 RepID=UPI001E8CFBFF|nr:uncharacterized protein LAJ45_08129 [Morchella importuna]KAH8147665.1 hypothetical protein LAJ45_08129 [Morchella importuna]
MASFPLPLINTKLYSAVCAFCSTLTGQVIPKAAAQAHILYNVVSVYLTHSTPKLLPLPPPPPQPTPHAPPPPSSEKLHVVTASEIVLP